MIEFVAILLSIPINLTSESLFCNKIVLYNLKENPYSL